MWNRKVGWIAKFGLFLLKLKSEFGRKGLWAPFWKGDLSLKYKIIPRSMRSGSHSFRQLLALDKAFEQSPHGCA